MTPPCHPRAGRLRTILVAVMLGLLGVLAGPATPASAHAVLVGSSPSGDSVVQEPPNQVVLTFSESVEPIAGRIRVIAPDGSREDTDQARSSGAQMIIPLRASGAQGTYLVTFRVVSADSHPVAGSVVYSVGEPSPGGPPTADEAATEDNRVILAAFPVIRWMGYVGLTLLVGAILVLALLWPQRLDRSGPIRAVWIGAGMVAVATFGELIIQVPYVAGSNIRASDVQEVLSSPYGAAHLIRLGVLGAAVVLARTVAQGQGWGADRVLLAVLGTIGVATWSVAGHPSASPVPMMSVLANMVHLASMSVWIGGLAMLIAFLLPKGSRSELAAIIPIWSRWAAYAVAALVLTGLAQALVEVGSLAGLVDTAYGWIIVAKVALVVMVMGIASLSRRMVEPIANRESGAARRLRTLVMAEAAVAMAVLAITSVLVQITPGRTAVAEFTGASVQTATMQDPLFTLIVDVEPAAVGPNEVHLYATTSDGQPADVQEWHVRAGQPSAGIEPIDAVILPITPDHAIATVNLPLRGTWEFSFTIRVSDIDQSTVTADLEIE